MKKYISVALIVVSLGVVNAQVIPENSINSNNPSSSAFIDASGYTDYNTKIGKGLYFPRTDLTQFSFNISDLGGYQYAKTAFDGFIVYNTGTGKTGSDANTQGIQVDVTPGFYYFSNPTATEDDANVSKGKWVRIVSGDVAGSSANRKIVDVTFSGTYAKIPDNTFASGDEIVNAYLLKQDTGEKVGSVKIERNTQRPGLTGDYVFSSNGPLYTTLNGNYKLVVDIKK